MASAILSSSFSSRLLALPAPLRLAAYQSARSFSASPARRASLVDIVIAGPNALLDGIHSLGIPWSATLPITAVLVRTLLTHFVSARPARRRVQIQNQLLPLASAQLKIEWDSGDRLQRRQEKQRERIKPTELDKLADRVERWRLGRKTMKKLSKAYGAGGFRPWGLLNFGILIAFTEAIRMKCGTREGLLPLLLSPFSSIATTVAPNQFPSPPPPPQAPLQPDTRDAAEIYADRLWASRENANLKIEAAASGPNNNAVVGPSSHPNGDLPINEGLPELRPEVLPDTKSPYFDPTMQTEGLSWCPDLTIPDPQVLPVVLAMSIVASAVFRPMPRSSGSKLGRNPINALDAPRRIGVAVGILFLFLSVKMPAAILLYFAPNILAGWLHSRYLDWKDPIQPAIMPCKRPIRRKVRREV